MPVVGPMRATLMSMSNGAQVPVACQTDLEGVTIRLGERVSFFVELPHWCDLDDDAGDGGSGDLADTLHAASDEPAAEADKPAAASDEPAPDEGAEAEADPEGATASSDEPEAPAADPEIVAEIAPQGVAASETAEPWVDPEEAVTMRQIAEANSVSESDPEAAPQADSESASADSVASADDAGETEADQPADAEPTEAPQISAPTTGVGSEGADLDTGPDLLSAAGRGWLDRFAQVRQDVRDAFRLDASLWHGRPARASDVTR